MSIPVDYNEKLATYSIRVTGLTFGNNNVLHVKFDTGAVCTIISLYALYSHVSKTQIEELKKAFKNASIEAEIFESATGHKLNGYPCVARNVMLSGSKVGYFPFYLVVDSKREIALLGNDFISFCDFSHKCGKDIVISKYHSRLAKRRFEQDRMVFDISEVRFA